VACGARDSAKFVLMQSAAGALVVTLRRSAIGASKTQMATLNGLGLKKKIGRTVERESEIHLSFINPINLL